ncbi:TetR/AcrR family transcriptional regulator [Gynuella sunshinyii]|uniref:Transcriptional regulator n=1 Tax=Gynuella sunshinyii YC6258 TaxID=1445510 RepID=A0A0C5VSV5_9GAMM|nr:TetR/AcrR family transcriptional regulator [Gynuella sunshinyii]AJQ96428.1 transcriptional regulator [Gynuella sunshinyii YC6258]
MVKSSTSKHSFITRQNILDATLYLILENGAQNVSLRKIANRINCSAPSIYYHFKNKNEIIVSLWEQEMAPVIAFSQSCHMLLDILNEYVQLLIKNKSLFLLICTNEQTDLEKMNSSRLFQKSLQDKITATPHRAEYPEQFTTIILAAIHGLVLSNTLKTSDYLKAHKLLEQMINLLIK